MTTIIGSIENGAYVARVAGSPIKVTVPLAPIGRRIGGIEVGAICANLGTTQVSGRFWRKLKRGLKKAVKKTVRVAKAVAHNKVIKNLYGTVKGFLPSPLNQALAAVETGVKFGKALAKGSSKAKRALPVVKQLAAGKITLKAAKRMAPSLGVKPNTIRDAAALIRFKAKAPTNPRIAELLSHAAKIEASVGPADETIMTGPSGRRYAVRVRRAA